MPIALHVKSVEQPWINNDLLRGQPRRLNCEWVTDNRNYFLVQIDEESEDVSGVNPLQLSISKIIPPMNESGHFLKRADLAAIKNWDKLSVLKELYEAEEKNQPCLFYLPIENISGTGTTGIFRKLREDFGGLIGTSGIVVRTSVRAGDEKLLNLPRTECLDPEGAAQWCTDQAGKLNAQYQGKELAFVAHRFVASKASAWVRAEPKKPHVQINALWGLPDALQYCPYDIWEVHVPTDVAVTYPEYKSHMLVPRSDGSWEHVRVKNDVARLNSISSIEAKNIASRSAQIAERLGKPCHIMWFIGCLDDRDIPFNMPWYWTEAHEAERNRGQGSYSVYTVSDQTSLDKFSAYQGSRERQALALKPSDPNLMRDNAFISSVATVASENRIPVILYGSTLAHAYYQLRKQECVVLTPNEKSHDRIRKAESLGKLVRDKIPEKIANRHELTVTQQVSGSIKKGFLISKLFEEVMEVREATTPDRKVEELGDVFELLRTIATADGIAMEDVRAAADKKKQKAGGFDEGLVLLQTGIGADEGNINDSERALSVVPAPKADDTFEIPFTFFGFAGLEQRRSVYLNELGLRLDIMLRTDRIEVQVIKNPEQLSLALDDD